MFYLAGVLDYAWYEKWQSQQLGFLKKQKRPRGGNAEEARAELSCREQDTGKERVVCLEMWHLSREEILIRALSPFLHTNQRRQSFPFPPLAG